MGYSDSATRYTYEFYVYTKKTNEVYPNGFGYHVVMKLMQPMLNQEHYYFLTKFTLQLHYQLICMLKILLHVTEKRKGFSVSTKNGKQWAKGMPRGEKGWNREGSCLSVQWIDNKIVAMLSIIDDANEYVAAHRKVKVNGK